MPPLTMPPLRLPFCVPTGIMVASSPSTDTCSLIRQMPPAPLTIRMVPIRTMLVDSDAGRAATRRADLHHAARTADEAGADLLADDPAGGPQRGDPHQTAAVQ